MSRARRGTGFPVRTERSSLASFDEALSNNWLDVWYQPKIDLRRKCLAGAEALVRMRHPHAGLLWPEDYLGVLEEEGLLKLSEYSLGLILELTERQIVCDLPTIRQIAKEFKTSVIALAIDE